MNCKEFEELMAAYLGTDLPPEKRPAFEQHIESCEKCQAEMASYKNCSRIFQKFVRDEDPPEALRTAVFSRCGCEDLSKCCPPSKPDKPDSTSS
jgi:anti-sigma factor RsiW